jgi:hypothetical protein
MFILAHFDPERTDADGRWYASTNAFYFGVHSPPTAKSHTSEAAIKRAFMSTYLIIERCTRSRDAKGGLNTLYIWVGFCLSSYLFRSLCDGENIIIGLKLQWKVRGWFHLKRLHFFDAETCHMTRGTINPRGGINPLSLIVSKIRYDLRAFNIGAVCRMIWRSSVESPEPRNISIRNQSKHLITTELSAETD